MNEIKNNIIFIVQVLLQIMIIINDRGLLIKDGSS